MHWRVFRRTANDASPGWRLERGSSDLLEDRPGRVEVFGATASFGAERRLRWMHGTLSAGEEGRTLF